jgi:hypothetical protein
LTAYRFWQVVFPSVFFCLHAGKPHHAGFLKILGNCSGQPGAFAAEGV